MEPAPPEKLLEAFRVLDPEDKGYVSKDNISKLMMEEGEPFTQEELDEMLATAVDQGSGNIPYEYYLNQLMVSHTYILNKPLHYTKIIPHYQYEPKKFNFCLS